tara:strand:- start:361 stop:819 length:459 start_codon:yes stop_codon:yes gene_type:complete
MLRKYMEGGKMYDHGGVHEGEPEIDLTFMTKENSDGKRSTQFLVEGRPVTVSQAQDYYASVKGPKADFNKWFNQAQMESAQPSAQNVKKIKEQILQPGYTPGMEYSSGQSRAQRATSGDLRSSRGGNEGIEGKSREDRMKKLLSGLGGYNQR